MPLSHDDRTRLAKLLAMFSSTFDGEILNAAKAAERLIKARGETWETVITTVNTVNSKHDTKQKPPSSHRSDFQDEIDKCVEKANFLTPWEREFLTSISERWSLSPKQRAILDRIKEKLKGYEGMDF